MAIFVRPDPARRSAHLADGHWRDRFVDQYLTIAAEQAATGVAVVDGDTILSHADVESSVCALAGGLADLGVEPGDVVSWQLPNWHEALLLHHAVLRLGAVSNPVNVILRGREVRYILKRARAKVMVIPGTFRGFDFVAMMAEIMPDLPDIAAVVTVRPATPVDSSLVDLMSRGAALAPTAEVSRTPDDVAVLMFTSGTTADPKGVLHTHNTLDYECQSVIDTFALDADDVVFMASPVTHVTGLLYGLQMPSMLRAPVVLQDVWEPGGALTLLERYQCTFTVAATPFLHGLVHHPERTSFDLTRFRAFVCGGADVPSALIREATEQLNCVASRAYGSTEMPILTTSGPDAPLEQRADTDGTAIGGAEFRILDEDDHAVPAGAVGELHTRGPEQFVGYLQAEFNDALLPGGWFRTGDLAVCDAAGRLTIRGRKKDIIVRGGENISVAEVEDLLFEHPDLAEIAIVAMPDPVMVERACAFAVPAAGARPTLESLADFLVGREIAKQKIPERLVLVDELPKTQSGKVQKFVLREQARQLVERLTP